MGNEYIFFDEAIREQFVHFIASHNIACTVRPDPMEGFIVELPEDLADDMEAVIEDKYEALLDAQRDLVNAAEDELFTFEEIHALVTLIAHNAINPVEGPLCRK